jgi:hypothetical protein
MINRKYHRELGKPLEGVKDTCGCGLGSLGVSWRQWEACPEGPTYRIRKLCTYHPVPLLLAEGCPLSQHCTCGFQEAQGSPLQRS